MMLRDGMARHCLLVNAEKEGLIQQLELIVEALEPLRKEEENAKEAAHVKSVRYGNIFFSVIATQFALSQYGTYILFSWDIMEPIMACVSLSDAIAGYFFWIWAGRPWDLDAVRAHFYERELNKRLVKHKINKEEMEQLKKTRQLIIDRLMSEN